MSTLSMQKPRWWRGDGCSSGILLCLSFNQSGPELLSKLYSHYLFAPPGTEAVNGEKSDRYHCCGDKEPTFKNFREDCHEQQNFEHDLDCMYEEAIRSVGICTTEAQC